MPIVKALSSFEHNGSVKRGQRINVSAVHAQQLIERGLVEATGEQPDDSGPQTPAGEELQSSASPADPASPQTTASKSASGASRPRRKKSDASSS